jgi:hypothetical protein
VTPARNMLRANLAIVCVTGVLAACGGSGSDDAGAGNQGGRGDGGAPDASATDATMGDAPSGDDGPGAPGDASPDAAAHPPTDAQIADTGGDGPLDASSGGACDGRAGAYTGAVLGTYTTRTATIGTLVPVSGDIAFTLGPAGSAGTTCMLGGESRDCGTLLAVQRGTIGGGLDQIHEDGGYFGGFPFFCSVTGALDCASDQLVGGWMECTYCLGPLATDGGPACVVGPASGVGGRFAGRLTASYDPATHAFVTGTWNGAEALAGNDGGSPGPEGGPPAGYLADSGVYLGENNFGGSGTWTATLE